MADRIREYQQATRRLQEATEQTEAVVLGVKYAAVLLEHWRQVEIVHPDFHGPRDTTMPLLASDWPTIDALVAALSEWHRANEAVHGAWNAIPEPERTGLMPPVTEW